MNYRKTDKKFIVTTSKEARDKLLYLGFTELTELNSTVFCFINNGKLTFENDDIKEKIAYTNVLCL